MTLREAKKILKGVTMACWWPSKFTGKKDESRREILSEAGLWLGYPVDYNRRREVQQACKVYYERG
jgi:hypothetical protein